MPEERGTLTIRPPRLRDESRGSDDTEAILSRRRFLIASTVAGTGVLIGHPQQARATDTDPGTNTEIDSGIDAGTGTDIASHTGIDGGTGTDSGIDVRDDRDTTDIMDGADVYPVPTVCLCGPCEFDGQGEASPGPSWALLPLGVWLMRRGLRNLGRPADRDDADP